VLRRTSQRTFDPMEPEHSYLSLEGASSEPQQKGRHALAPPLGPHVPAGLL
jgi:hypothetical protein